MISGGIALPGSRSTGSSSPPTHSVQARDSQPSPSRKHAAIGAVMCTVSA